DLVVTDGTAGLDDGLDAGVGKHLEAVREREERVGGGDGTLGALDITGEGVGALNGQLGGVDAVDLAHAHAHGGGVTGDEDGVGLDGTDRGPGELQVGQHQVGDRL